MKQFSSFLLASFLLAFATNTAEAQSTYVNTPNTITFTMSTPDCNGMSPASGVYSMVMSYTDPFTFGTVNYPTTGSVNVQVTQSTVNGFLTLTVNAAGASPAANWPDLTTTLGGLSLINGSGGFAYQFQFGQVTCSALPIILEYFNTSLSGGYAYLSWKTDQEQNTDHVNVQRAVPGAPGVPPAFVNVGIEPAAGNSDLPLLYSFYAPIVSGTNYFRLQFVDWDGRFTYSPVNTLTVPANGWPTSLCNFVNITGPATLCPGATGIYKIHNSPPGTITWSDSPTNDALSPLSAGTAVRVTNTSYTGATTLTASGACPKSFPINGTPTNNLTITGPASICTGGSTYTLSNLAGISTVSWSVSPTTLASLSATSGGSTTLTRIGTASGTATLTAVYTNVGCSVPVSVSTNVFVGTPTGYCTATVSCPILSATAHGVTGATGYHWYVYDYTTHTQTIFNTTAASYSRNITGGHYYNIGFSYTNSCGTSAVAYSDGEFICNGTICPRAAVVSPNPSRGQVVVNIQICPQPVIAAPQEKLSPTAPTFSADNNDQPLVAPPPMKTAVPSAMSIPSAKWMIYQIKVVDKTGKIRKVFNYSAGVDNITLDLGELPSDIYTLQLYDNKTWVSSQKVILTK